jgi:thiamine-monophosphate kinase
MNEFELISELTRSLPSNESVLVGAGDDCAVLKPVDPHQLVLFKTDAIVEGVHFDHDDPPEKIGRKALARCLSDVAAMGGAPTCALVTIGLPKQFDADQVKRIYAGLSDLARQYGVAVAGGETTASPDRIFLSISLLGKVDREHCVLRSGAKPGDAIFVTGELGGSRGGKHLDFEPRLEEGQWLAGHFNIHAMIDLSDGLAGDLRHLMHAGSVGAELRAGSIPISREAKLQAAGESSAKPPLLAALTDGEDFELLFTVASRDAVPLLDAWKARFPKLRLSCIGKVTATPGLKLRDENGLRELPTHGYVHFA